VPAVLALSGAPAPGIVDIPGTTGTGLLVVASVNVGAPGSLTISAHTGGVVLPIQPTVCETYPVTSQPADAWPHPRQA
jgi:hypothetical protein